MNLGVKRSYANNRSDKERHLAVLVLHVSVMPGDPGTCAPARRPTTLNFVVGASEPLVLGGRQSWIVIGPISLDVSICALLCLADNDKVILSLYQA